MVIFRATASSAETKITQYEASVDEYRAEIVDIKAGSGIYSGLSNKEKRDAIKSKEDAIHDCEQAIDRLRQQQPQQQQGGRF